MLGLDFDMTFKVQSLPAHWFVEHRLDLVMLAIYV